MNISIVFQKIIHTYVHTHTHPVRVPEGIPDIPIMRGFGTVGTRRKGGMSGLGKGRHGNEARWRQRTVLGRAGSHLIDSGRREEKLPTRVVHFARPLRRR